MKDKRKIEWWKLSTDLPLTSERVKIILSNPEDSKKLVDAIRNYRKTGKGSFSISQETKNKIDK